MHEIAFAVIVDQNICPHSFALLIRAWLELVLVIDITADCYPDFLFSWNPHWTTCGSVLLFRNLSHKKDLVFILFLAVRLIGEMQTFKVTSMPVRAGGRRSHRGSRQRELSWPVF